MGLEADEFDDHGIVPPIFKYNIYQKREQSGM
jgi:hypothetical protein